MLYKKSLFCCPVCGEVLETDGKNYKCSKNHSFDAAKSGYVNLDVYKRQMQHRSFLKWVCIVWVALPQEAKQLQKHVKFMAQMQINLLQS